MRNLLPSTAFALALLALSGCGQTGPLQLPPREPAPPAAEPQPPAGDTEVAPATAPASNG
ncbi:lipoprotein [Haliea sp.]|uniref:LPS translocon maturation chaperone LptM n=1 Tax=Haliea sp. TaxID=1932666 RepID=UPI0032ED9C2D